MNRLCKPALVFTTAALTAAGLNAHAQLQLNMDYSGFLTGPSGSANTILNGASLNDAIAVMDQAAAIWEDAFAESSSGLGWASGGVLSQTISVGWANHGGSTLAKGGTSWSNSAGRWSGGSLDWDGDNSSAFFVDPTPGDNNEWRQSSARSLSMGGVSVNIERVSYDAPAGTARDNNDMLSVALHELGHAIGWLGGYPLYSAADLGNDNDIDITSGPFSGADIPINGGHTNLSIGSPGNDAKGTGRSDFPYDPGSGWFSNLDYNPTVLSPSGFNGVRYGLTEADILVVAEYLDFDLDRVNYAPDPSSFVAGDLNNDGTLTNADISAFVLALTDTPGYDSAYPGVDADQRGDFTGDSMLTNGDIAGFVAALTAPAATASAFSDDALFSQAFSDRSALAAVPEPSTLALLALAGVTAVRRRRDR